MYAFANGDPEDMQAQTLAQRLETAGDDIGNLDWAWCSTVSQSLLCKDNDEVVPADHQDLLRGVNRTLVTDGSPVHTNETNLGSNVMPDVFDKLGIARR